MIKLYDDKTGAAHFELPVKLLPIYRRVKLHDRTINNIKGIDDDYIQLDSNTTICSTFKINYAYCEIEQELSTMPIITPNYDVGTLISRYESYNIKYGTHIAFNYTIHINDGAAYFNLYDVTKFTIRDLYVKLPTYVCLDDAASTINDMLKYTSGLRLYGTSCPVLRHDICDYNKYIKRIS